MPRATSRFSVPPGHRFEAATAVAGASLSAPVPPSQAVVNQPLRQRQSSETPVPA